MFLHPNRVLLMSDSGLEPPSSNGHFKKKFKPTFSASSICLNSILVIRPGQAQLPNGGKRNCQEQENASRVHFSPSTTNYAHFSAC